MRIVSLYVEGQSRTAIVEGGQLRLVDFDGDTYALVKAAWTAKANLPEFIARHAGNTLLDYERAFAENRLAIPCMHPDPAHCLVSGTGLTHTGSADTRNAMHAKLQDEHLSDSMKMFKAGIEAGKPAPGETGAEPEWFYKGDGDAVVAANGDLQVPDFAEDAGEEPEIAALYLIDEDGEPKRIGFCLGNEFSDHIKERRNYLLLAHSKLRPCSIGPEILLGDLPAHIEGVSRIFRHGKLLWEKAFVTGEDNMVHSIANLERHHFKYAAFRRPGDLHIHFFGTATLSFADGIAVRDGDVFEIESATFGKPLRNRVVWMQQNK